MSKKNILITGCSSGFGLLMAVRLSAAGHHVIATMRNLGKKETLLKEVERRGGTIDLLPLDVTDTASIDKVIEHITEQYNHLDVLINNAGYGLAGFFEGYTDEEIRAQFDTNFFGVLNVTRRAIPLMRGQTGAKIINISSRAGLSASPCFSAYTSSKWALEGFSEALRYDLKPFGIDVLLIEPGVYKTEIFYDNARRAKDFENPQSPNFQRSQYLKGKAMDVVGACRSNPEQVAILAEKLIHARNPSFRNMPDAGGRWAYIIKKFIPFRIYSWIVDRVVYTGFKS